MVSIGAGISIGPGINIEYYKTPYSSMRDLLSASGQTAYDAATSGDFFVVSQADFEAVESQMADVYTRGASTRTVAQSSWANGFGFIHSPYESICYAGGKIIGLQHKFASMTTAATVNLATGTSYLGTYANSANQWTVATSGGTTRKYYLRKEAPDEASNVFSTVRHTSGGSMEGTTGHLVQYYSGSAGGVSGWTQFGGGASQSTQFLYVLPSSVGLVSSGLLLNLVSSSRASILSGSTAIWRDISGNSNTVTSLNMSAATTNQFPAYFSLNGTTQYFNAGTLLSTGGSFTKEAWIYRGASTGVRAIISNSNAPFLFNANTLTAGVGNNTTLVSEAGVTTTLAWMHVAVTWDHATQTMTLYRGGVQTAQAVTSGLSYDATEPIYLGASGGAGPSYSPNSYFNGRFGEVRIYNRALTSSEITRNYNASKTVMGQ